MNFPPPDQVVVYVENLRADLIFLILEFVQSLFDYYQICPVQLVSNFIRLIISFA